MLTLQSLHITDNRWYLSKLYNSLTSIGKEKGALTELALLGMMSASACSAMIVSSFCMEGSVRSIKEVIHDKRRIVRMRPLGDVGGWTSLAVFSLIVIKQLFDKIIKEGEFFHAQAQGKEWLQIVRAEMIEKPEIHAKIYQQLNEYFDALSLRCFFSKSIVSNRISLLEIYPGPLELQNNTSYGLDKKLEPIYRKVQSKLTKKTSTWNYIERLISAKNEMMQKSRMIQIATLIFGIVIPIILILNATLSMVGEFGLGKELFVDKKELVDVGHFGEWPINAMEALSASYLLHTWFVINEGDLAFTRKVYAKQLNLLQNEAELHNRLAKAANQEMSLLAGSCGYFKRPFEYKFESI